MGYLFVLAGGYRTLLEFALPTDGADKPGLTRLLASWQKSLHAELSNAREAIAHSGTKGTESEDAWVKMLNEYLPRRYVATRAAVVDSDDNQSEQIDVVIHDRQYTPWVMKLNSACFVPAEAVYAAFEVKQTFNKEWVEYAASKIASVRRLHRTSLPIPHAGGQFKAKPPAHILGGILTLDSDWRPAFGDPFHKVLGTLDENGLLDLGCVINAGVFRRTEVNSDRAVECVYSESALARFLLELIAKLQSLGTVPMIDVRAYARWTEPTEDRQATTPDDGSSQGA